MKAIYCPYCIDIVVLTYEMRSCRCGKCKGKYVDPLNAETNGEGIAMALGLGDFEGAMARLSNAHKDLDRDWYKDNCRLNYVWFRPHFGPGNPHTRPMEGEECSTKKR